MSQVSQKIARDFKAHPSATAGHCDMVCDMSQCQSSSASRVMAGARGFSTFSQCRDRPKQYVDPRRVDTMPSRPSFSIGNRRKSSPSYSSRSKAQCTASHKSRQPAPRI